MRLTLRKKLKPYERLSDLAKTLDLSLPALKRLLREPEPNKNLSIQKLIEGHPPDFELEEEGVFELFHQHGRCLVCGNLMTCPSGREIGWGEFIQCEQCQYSAHEMANYKARREAANKQLREMIQAAWATQSVLKSRSQNFFRLKENRSKT